MHLCLSSVQRQTVQPGEIIIADDGSGNETKQVIESFAKQTTVPLKHIWQEDEGYQLSKIRNKAFAAAETDYLVQTDGDLIFHKRFIEDHLNFAKPGYFVSGARVNIAEWLTAELVREQKLPELHFYSAGISKRYNAFRSVLLRNINSIFQASSRPMQYVLGCNMAFWRKDILKVNGYNENFTGWGKEDNDIAARLLNAGIQLRFLKFGGMVFHLWHREAVRHTLSANEELLQKTVVQNTTFIENGISRYLN